MKIFSNLRSTSKLLPLQQGFTLIELLVVMTILGILTVLVVGAYQSSQVRARDARRKADLKEVSNALEQFYSDYQIYPDSASGMIVGCPYNPETTSDSCAWGSSTDSFEDDKGTIYMRTLPEDPSGYVYFYRRTQSGQAYQLYTYLENPDDRSLLTDLTNSPSCGSQICNFGMTSPNTTPYEDPAL